MKTKILYAVIAGLVLAVIYLVLTTDRYYYFKVGEQKQETIKDRWDF